MATPIALLLVLANLHTAHPRVELQFFETFKECRAFAIKQNHIGYYAKCVDAWSKGGCGIRVDSGARISGHVRQ
jgi:hypothetical protein